jgi:hypothetical protein
VLIETLAAVDNFFRSQCALQPTCMQSNPRTCRKYAQLRGLSPAWALHAGATKLDKLPRQKNEVVQGHLGTRVWYLECPYLPPPQHEFKQAWRGALTQHKRSVSLAPASDWRAISPASAQQCASGWGARPQRWQCGQRPTHTNPGSTGRCAIVPSGRPRVTRPSVCSCEPVPQPPGSA